MALEQIKLETLGDLKRQGYYLTAHCKGNNCGHGKRLDTDKLIEQFKADYVFIKETRIAAACRCEECGHKGATLRLSPGGLEFKNSYQWAKGG